MMRRSLASAVMLLCAGCDGSTGGSAPSGSTGGASATAAAAAAAPAGLSGLKATVNGEPLALQTAVAYSHGGKGIELSFSTATPSCEDFGGNGRTLARDEQHFSVTIGPMLAKDGTETWGVGRLSYDSHTEQGGDIGKVKITSADAKAGVSGELELELKLKANAFMHKPARTLVVKGPFSAKGCGVFEHEDGPPARPQRGQTLKVAGKPFDVVAALVKPTTFPSKGHELLLSSAPASCERSPSDADLTLKLNIGDGGGATYAFMAGNVLSSQLNATPRPDAPTITAKPEGSFDGDGEVKLALSGELEVLDYAVSVAGEVSALRCPAK